MHLIISTVILLVSWSHAAIADSREDILTAQRTLTYLGFNPGGVDGSWGSKSERALVDFLSQIGLEFDGQLDDTELELLVEAVHLKAAENPTSYANFKDSGLPPYEVPSLGYLQSQSFRDIFRTPLDIDGDGVRELFVMSALYSLEQSPSTATTGYFGVYRADERGRFHLIEGLIENPEEVCIHPRKGIVSDFNADGLPDIFVACHGFDRMPFQGEKNVVVLSQPTGQYRIDTASSDVGFFHGAAAADFNNDGLNDVIMVNGVVSNPVYILLNDGTGHFNRARGFVPTATHGSHGWFTIEVPDINGDGIFDLMVGGHEWERGPTLLFINPGNNDFSGATPILVPPVEGMGIVLDVVVTADDNQRDAWFLRTSGGDGTFYQGVAVQKVSWPDLTTELVSERRGERWFPAIYAWEDEYGRFVGSDDSRNYIPPVER